MAFTLPELPYSLDALKPNISAETSSFIMASITKPTSPT